MTQHTVSHPAFEGSGAAHRWLQGIEHGHVPQPPRALTFSLWKWFPRELEHHGRRTSRESERAYSDLQAAVCRAEW